MGDKEREKMAESILKIVPGLVICEMTVSIKKLKGR